jgi:hypothetical protein
LWWLGDNATDTHAKSTHRQKQQGGKIEKQSPADPVTLNRVAIH